MVKHFFYIIAVSFLISFVRYIISMLIIPHNTYIDTSLWYNYALQSQKAVFAYFKQMLPFGFARQNRRAQFVSFVIVKLF